MTLPEASSSDDMQDGNKALREPDIKSQTKKTAEKASGFIVPDPSSVDSERESKSNLTVRGESYC